MASTLAEVDGFPGVETLRLHSLRHVSAARPFVFGLREVSLFDELTLSARDDARPLIPDATRRLLAEETNRKTIEAFFAADLHVSVAAGCSPCTRTHSDTGSGALPS